MKERPLLFSAPMVRAILAGRKRQTRRVVTGFEIRGPHPPGLMDVYRLKGPGAGWCAAFKPGESSGSSAASLCPYGVPGDRLWVRETWLPDPPIDGWPGDVEWNGCGRPIAGVPAHYRKPDRCIFAASWEGAPLAWRSSIHMPRWASRITLELTDVRVQRLQETTEADVMAEGGVQREDLPRDPDNFHPPGSYGFVSGLHPFPQGRIYPTPQEAFAERWDSINGKRAPWASNPWVWALSFTRVEAGA